MNLNHIIAFKLSLVATLLGVTVAVSLPCAHAASAALPPGAPVAKGQKIVMATHSFNVFIGPVRPNARNPGVKPGPGPLAALAAERGKLGHETLQVQMIGGSTPLQHWNQGDGDDAKNLAKVALARAGDQLDVFTLSPNAVMPEEGIDKFGDFVIAHNPNARILVQVSWSSWDGHGRTPSVGGTGGGSAVRDADLSQIAFCLLDVDVYEATRESLVFLAPRMAPRSFIVLDDVYRNVRGVTDAVDEFLRDNPSYLMLPLFPSQGVLLSTKLWSSDW
jgi:hypothetical protein